MTPEDLDRRSVVALDIVREAGGLALRYFGRLDQLTVKLKGLQDLASEADLNTELLIRDRLKAAFPEDGFLGEETGLSGETAASGSWVVDPIDGTQPFVNGLTAWCVSVAFAVAGVMELGFVYAPARDEFFVARKGGAATLNGRPIRVSSATRIDNGLVGIGYSPRIKPERFLPLFANLLQRGGMFVREGSGALTLCYVGCGRLIGYIEPHINSWDCLAAIAVIEAAGGRVNDFLANDGLRQGNHLVAGPPGTFAELEGLFGQTFPARAELLKAQQRR